MTAPGTVVQVQTSTPPRSAPTNSGVWFAAGEAYSGPLKPVLVQSLQDFINTFGARQSYSFLYDAVDIFFREGGNSAYISRVVGPAAVAAFHNLLDGSAAISLVVTAQGPGAYGNNLKVQVLAGIVSGFQIQILDQNSNILENSGDLVDQAHAVQWSNNSNWVTVTLGAASDNPVVAAATALAGGVDDLSNITDTQWLNALNLFTPDLGPGQVSAPGRTTNNGYAQLAQHAAANNRIAILDLPDTPTIATIETSAASVQTGTGDGQYAAPFWPWYLGPGPGGTVRDVPPCGAVAGRIAAVDAAFSPGQPAAGINGIFSSNCLGLSQAAVLDSVRDTLNQKGINVIRPLYGSFRIYGWRTLADPINNPQWVELGTARYLMSLVGRCKQVGEQFVFALIDGQGHKLAEYNSALSALCQEDWVAGEIYGATADQAFSVDTGPDVNTPDLLASGQIAAVVSVRPSPDSEIVSVYIVNTPITGSV